MSNKRNIKISYLEENDDGTQEWVTSPAITVELAIETLQSGRYDIGELIEGDTVTRVLPGDAKEGARP